MKKYLVFIIQAFEQQTPEGHIIDATTLELIDDSYDEALIRAKQIITKKFYRLSSVIENFQK
jgi:hypothetical protein